jgi:peptidoglycan/xylan/chitin deacetylase (PgdA/CDA1 family)
VKGDPVPETERRFLNWEEAREMIEGGMAFGSHTHSHHVLSQLDANEQLQELSLSRTVLREKLGCEAESIAYPVGGPTAFSETTKQLARQSGYRVAFSFYGGTNSPGQTPPYDVKRIGIGGLGQTRFKTQVCVCRATGHYWP